MPLSHKTPGFADNDPTRLAQLAERANSTT
jgi:hypothetical protein